MLLFFMKPFNFNFTTCLLTNDLLTIDYLS